MLGMTEAGSVLLISGDESDQPEHRRGSYGRPAPGFETKVVDPTGDGPGATGELCIRGPYRDAAATTDAAARTASTPTAGFTPAIWSAPTRTATSTSSARAGSMIKTSGANVSPGEVREGARGVTAARAHVLGLPDSRARTDRGRRGRDGRTGRSTEAAARRRSRAELSAYKMPRRFLAVPPRRGPAVVQRQGRHARVGEAVR